MVKEEHFDGNNLKKEIKNMLITRKISPKDFLAFKNIVLEALNLNFPLRTKYLRANHLSFMRKISVKSLYIGQNRETGF